MVSLAEAYCRFYCKSKIKEPFLRFHPIESNLHPSVQFCREMTKVFLHQRISRICHASLKRKRKVLYHPRTRHL